MTRRLVLTLLLASAFQDAITKVSGPWLYVVAFVLTFAETGTLLFFIPGEFTLIFAGIACQAGDLNLAVMIVVGCVAAILGDATGFGIGKRWGKGLQRSRLGRRLEQESWDRAEGLVRRRRGLIVLVGRWIGFLRAIMPATAGMAELDYKSQFLPYDVVGAVSWVCVCVLAGYFLGEKAEELITKFGWVLGGIVVVGFVIWLLIRRRKRAKTLLVADTAPTDPPA